MAANRNDDLILSALLTNPKIRDAAAVCGIPERTVYKRLADPAFKERYEAERRAIFDQSAAALQSYLTAAIQAMGEIVSDKEAGQQTRLNAAELIIRNSLRMTERTDVLDRLDALEKRGNE